MEDYSRIVKETVGETITILEDVVTGEDPVKKKVLALSDAVMNYEISSRGFIENLGKVTFYLKECDNEGVDPVKTLDQKLQKIYDEGRKKVLNDEPRRVQEESFTELADLYEFSETVKDFKGFLGEGLTKLIKAKRAVDEAFDNLTSEKKYMKMLKKDAFVSERMNKIRTMVLEASKELNYFSKYGFYTELMPKMLVPSRKSN